MPGPQPPAVNLSEAEQQGLDELVKAHSTPQQLAVRARIILTASHGLNNEQVGRALHVGVDMVRYWRQRWLAGQVIPLSELSVEERLQDLPRAGKPSAITADQLCQITALACENRSNRRGRSANGRAARLRTRSCSAASWRRFRPAMPHGCSKGNLAPT